MHVVVEIVKARAEYVPAGNDVEYGDAGVDVCIRTNVLYVRVINAIIYLQSALSGHMS
jgi:hypothetical protein